ncbi:hypothetical protein BT93_J1923 [Corymbia citriodora subsp. variegata]|nr:hypothetical protein BT93_J1923 [Corymbia citriodora subsp. variegata]KAF8011454.1 hypothetical protein BT93_J1923 [Corymbia citriodora subsp. variegata]KAF8011455.1 hypothetical protein BT93_J1923 [Corymbia citriodora subsp. variegata]KAF8011456.1 hypothetical protein BT93_J1923 [Corymbia citriodora subsp. variegata]
MGENLKRLSESCYFVNSDGEQEQTCASCAKTWEEMRSMQPVATKSESVANDTDICRFAILVSLTSTRIEDSSYAQGIYRCLGEQTGGSENEIKPKGKPKLGIGIWVLIGVLGGAVMALLISIIIWLKRLCKPNSEPKRAAFKDVLLIGPCCPKVPIKEVYTATNNLHESNFIGQGIAGRVYKGIMPNNQHVAIKHIISDVNVETVVREVTSLSHVQHLNLVSLMGCCVNEDECFLVYELCPNGNLSEWLFGKDRVLSWIQRLEIAIDGARGLLFLHTYPEGCIVHRDIKPTNILLGPNFEAKLSDFGLSKVIDLGEAYVSSEVRGTFGYLDPEYQNNRQVNSSGDVYSFGIVLLQILSGKKVINLNQEKPMPLDKMAKALIRGGSITDFADPKLEGKYSAEAFNITLQLALSCTGLKQQRPSMEQVAEKLVEALEISTKAKASSPEPTLEWLSSSTE